MTRHKLFPFEGISCIGWFRRRTTIRIVFCVILLLARFNPFKQELSRLELVYSCTDILHRWPYDGVFPSFKGRFHLKQDNTSWYACGVISNKIVCCPRFTSSHSTLFFLQRMDSEWHLDQYYLISSLLFSKQAVKEGWTF